MNRSRRLLLVAAAALVVVGAGVATLGPTIKHEFQLWRSCLASESIESRYAADRHMPGTSGRLVAFIGDSWAQGAELPNALDAFPYGIAQATGDAIIVDGKQGTGYLNPGPCKDEPVSTRIADTLEARPDVLVLALGVNDAVWQGREQAVEKAFDQIDTDRPDRVVVLGPFDPPLAEHDRVDEMAAILASAAADHGFEFVPMAGVVDSYLPDDLHPDVEGRRALVSYLAQVIGSAPGS